MVLETTTNVWDIYDVVSPFVSRTVVAHAAAVRQIAEARVKTDKQDSGRLFWITQMGVGIQCRVYLGVTK